MINVGFANSPPQQQTFLRLRACPNPPNLKQVASFSEESRNCAYPEWPMIQRAFEKKSVEKRSCPFRTWPLGGAKHDHSLHPRWPFQVLNEASRKWCEDVRFNYRSKLICVIGRGVCPVWSTRALAPVSSSSCSGQLHFTGGGPVEEVQRWGC